MNNFIFHNPTKVIFGPDRLNLLARETGVLGKNILLVTGVKSFVNSPQYNILSKQLACNFDVSHLSGISMNPDLEKIREGIELCKAKKISSIIAAGGGAVMDSAKAIGAGSMVDHDPWKFFTGKKSIKSSLPLICIPTTAGTGSEVNGGMAVTNREKSQKIGIGNRNLYPVCSFLDPALTYTLDRHQTFYGAVDIISHILEMYMSCDATSWDIQASFFEGILQNVLHSHRKILANPKEYGSRAQMMWAGSLALHGLLSAGMGKFHFLMHLLEHTLSVRINVPHGQGLAALLPGFLELQKKTNNSRVNRLNKTILPFVYNFSGKNYPCFSSFIKEWIRKNHCVTSMGELGFVKNDVKPILKDLLVLSKVCRYPELSSEYAETFVTYCLSDK